MARKWKRREERIREMVDAAEREFLDKGYDGVALGDIAKRVGVSPSLVYQYFPHKANVLSLVCDRLLQPLATFMDSADEERNALEALRKFTRDYLSFWEHNPRLAEFYLLDRVHSTEDDLRRAQYIGEHATLFAWLHQKFARGEKEGSFRPHNRAVRTNLMMFAIEGAMIHVAILKDTKVKKAAEWIDREVLSKA
jgi:AcrR family transcriptional regulator